MMRRDLFFLKALFLFRKQNNDRPSSCHSLKWLDKRIIRGPLNFKNQL